MGWEDPEGATRRDAISTGGSGVTAPYRSEVFTADDGELGIRVLGVTQAEWDAAIEYIELLQDALLRSAGYVYVNGWAEDEAVIKRGKELRALLRIKGAGG